MWKGNQYFARHFGKTELVLNWQATNMRGVKESKSQTLITGVYRTGTEYFAHLVNCHPQINVTMYRVNVLRFIYNKYNPISEVKNLVRAIDDLEKRIGKRYGLKLNKDIIIEKLKADENIDYGKFYDTVMCSLYLRGSEEHWAEKNQLLWREIPIFLEVMPNGKTILIVRDPRSVLLSFREYTYAAPPAYLGAVYNSLDALRCGLKYEKELSKDKFRYFRYEDFAREPENIIAKVWDFLGLEGNNDIGDQDSWKDAYGNPWYANSSFQRSDDLTPFDCEASINRWQMGLSVGEISLVEGVCGNLMKKFGYETTGKEPDWLEAMRLFANDDKMFEVFRNWLKTGAGIEAFPTDPLDERNWSSN